MIKFSFDKTKEIAHPNNRITLVTLKGTLRLPFRSLPKTDKLLTQFDPLYSSWTSYIRNSRVRVSFISDSVYDIAVTGKAKRSVNDPVNRVLGERIAESRAKKRLYDLLYKVSTTFLQEYLDAINADGSVEKYLKLSQAEQEHIEELISQSGAIVSQAKSDKTGYNYYIGQTVAILQWDCVEKATIDEIDEDKETLYLNKKTGEEDVTSAISIDSEKLMPWDEYLKMKGDANDD